jgi:hypothetical protein
MSVFDHLGGIVSSPTARDEPSQGETEIDIDIDSALSLLATERRRLASLDQLESVTVTDGGGDA